MPRRRPEFEPGEAGAKADKLKKFINAGGPQMQWLFDVGRTNFCITSGIHREGCKNWEMPRRRPEFEPGEAGAKADKLKKFINAGGPQMQWLFDVGRTNFCITSGIHREGCKNWEMPRRRPEFEPGEADACSGCSGIGGTNF